MKSFLPGFSSLAVVSKGPSGLSVACSGKTFSYVFGLLGGKKEWNVIISMVGNLGAMLHSNGTNKDILFEFLLSSGGRRLKINIVFYIYMDISI